MVNDERLVTFLHSLDSGNGPYLDALQAEASGEGVPIIRQEMQSFLQLFLELKKPNLPSATRDKNRRQSQTGGLRAGAGPTFQRASLRGGDF